MASDEEKVDPERGEEAPESAAAAALGRAIKVLRTVRGVDRRVLAEKAGLSYSYLAEIENGKKSPSPSAQKAIADALGVSVGELLAEAKRLLVRARRHERVAEARTAFEVESVAGFEDLAQGRLEAEPVAQAPSERRLHALRMGLPTPESDTRLAHRIEALSESFERLRASLDELRAAQERASAERQELSDRLTRWQDRFDRRLTEMTAELARMGERQKLLAARIEAVDSALREMPPPRDRTPGREG